MQQDKEVFKARVRQWAEKLDIHIQTISMRQMKNKWDSYTKRSDLLIFNLELLDMDEEIGDYVIVHELLHFKMPNHGILWKSMMRAHLGDYQAIEKRLNQLNHKVYKCV